MSVYAIATTPYTPPAARPVIAIWSARLTPAELYAPARSRIPIEPSRVPRSHQERRGHVEEGTEAGACGRAAAGGAGAAGEAPEAARRRGRAPQEQRS